MCGIFGFSAKKRSRYNQKEIENILRPLFKLSESRGKEAAGLAVKTAEGISILKSPLCASDFLKTGAYKRFISQVLDNASGSQGFISVIGHSRLATHGSEYKNQNNQPVIKDKAVCVHNGIIANHEELWKKFPSLKKETEVDTEVFLALLQLFFDASGSLPTAIKKVFEAVEGSASVAALFNDNYHLLLASNTGSLYFCRNHDQDALVFGSERYILEKFIDKIDRIVCFDKAKIERVSPGSGLIFCLLDLSVEFFSFLKEPSLPGVFSMKTHKEAKFVDYSAKEDDVFAKNIFINTTNYVLTPETKEAMTENWERIYDGEGLKRCTKCLLPESTMFIDFDENGVCNYCRDYKKIKYFGEAELERIASTYRRDDGGPDIIFLFSGGRDSSYGLHYLKKNLNMNPIAFTYDWGVLTDLGRRNQARICGDLGVEHIVISADIRRKRNNIKKNVEAWLRRPELGMVPLFMAGDKELLKQIEWLKRKTGAKKSFDAAAPGYEADLIKIGFAGIKLKYAEQFFSEMPYLKKLRLMKYYGSRFLLNPGYINSSLLDTAYGFYCSFFFLPTSLHLFDYIEWEEKKLVSTIIDACKWETEKDTKATWRIDDGTAPFYNYIYMAVGGLNENDVFRSIQIREGQIDRQIAYNLIKEENKPRFESLEWYGKIIGFDLNKAIRRINLMPKKYKI